jgi:hypothetical protein
MAMTLMQRLRLWFRGASRRREERDRAFLTSNAGWGAATASTPAPPSAPAQVSQAPSTIDREGLQAAYLDGSGRIAYYLDISDGEVVEVRDAAPLAEPRYRRVPTQSHDADREAFLAALEPPVRLRFERASSFRAALAEDRTIERAWYNFRNDRATAAIERWLRDSGLTSGS